MGDGPPRVGPPWVVQGCRFGPPGLRTALVTRRARDLELTTVANRFIEMNRFSSSRHCRERLVNSRCGNRRDEGKRDCKSKTFVSTTR